MLKSALCLLVFSGTGFAAEGKSAREWIKELTETFRSHQGYIAKYHSERPNKSLELTVATHFGSGLGSLEVELKAGGEMDSMRSWITADEIMYFDPFGPERYRFRGLADEIRFLVGFNELSSDFKTASTPLTISANPGLMLTGDSLAGGLKVHSTVIPMWKDAVKGAETAKLDEKEVTFETKLHGLVTVSRENGIMTRQNFPDSPDGPRVLELVELKLDPDADTILKISADWTTLGAEDAATSYLTSEHRKSMFQAIIDGIESGAFELKKLETKLDEDRLALRKFAGSSISTKPGTKAARLSAIIVESFKSFRPVLKKHWLESVPGANADDIEAFEAYSSNPATQEEILDQMIDGILKGAEKIGEERLRELIMPEFFGPGPEAPLTAKAASGRIAKQLLEDALVKGYFEALTARHLAVAVREREGLD